NCGTIPTVAGITDGRTCAHPNSRPRRSSLLNACWNHAAGTVSNSRGARSRNRGSPYRLNLVIPQPGPGTGGFHDSSHTPLALRHPPVGAVSVNLVLPELRFAETAGDHDCSADTVDLDS